MKYIMKKITSKRFTLLIEELVHTKNLTYLEAVCYHCEQNGLETNTVTKWISPAMKEKIQYDAEQLNYLPKTTALPI